MSRRMGPTLGYLLYFLYNMWDCIFYTCHSSLGDREDIFVTHLIIIIKSEVSTFPIVVPEVVLPSYAIGFMYILGNLVLCFFITVQACDLCK